MKHTQSYLESQIRTATPQRLRKMLIDGAIRFAVKVRQDWHENKYDIALTSVERLRMILDELFSSIKGESSIAMQTKSIYAFLMQQLIKAQATKDVTSLNEMIEILKIEQQTWELVCQKQPEALTDGGNHSPIEITADSGRMYVKGPNLCNSNDLTASTSRLTLEC